jgi:hypothetical protein
MVFILTEARIHINHRIHCAPLFSTSLLNLVRNHEINLLCRQLPYHLIRRRTHCEKCPNSPPLGGTQRRSKPLLYATTASASGEESTPVTLHLRMRTFCACTSGLLTRHQPCVAIRALQRGRPSFVAGNIRFARRRVSGAAEIIAGIDLLTTDMKWRTAPSAS